MIVKLVDIFNLQMGKTPARNNKAYWNDGEYDWISISDLGNNIKYVSSTKEKITELAIKESGIKKVPSHTLLMSFKLSVGKTAITKYEVYTNEAIMAFIPNHKYDVYIDYFYYLFSWKDWSNDTSRAVMGATLNKSTLGQIMVKIPPLDEQRKIAETLDKVSNLIAKRKDQIEKLDLLVKSKFVEMFGDINSSELYPYKKIKDFTIVISGGTPDRNNSDYWDNGCIPWVKTTELQNSLINESQEKITVDGMKNSSAKLVPPNTILLAMYGQGKTRGMTGYLGFESTTNQACACILPSETINQKYLWKYLIFSYDKLRNLAKGGNQPNLNCNMIKEFEVLFPPIELQNKFADFVQQIEQSKILINKSLEKMETLKKALMQEYFG